MKKIISILLCVVLMISLAMPVAANEGDAIESENPEVAAEEAPEDNTEIGEESSAEDEEDVTEGEKILPEHPKTLQRSRKKIIRWRVQRKTLLMETIHIHNQMVK